MYKNLVLYELFYQKGQNDFCLKKMSQLTVCCKQTEMLFDSLQCNSRGKIGKLRD